MSRRNSRGRAVGFGIARFGWQAVRESFFDACVNTGTITIIFGNLPDTFVGIYGVCGVISGLFFEYIL